MRPLLLLLASLLAAAPASGSGLTEREDPPVDGAQIAGLGSNLAVQITPDGRWVAFTVALASGVGTPSARLTDHVYVRDRTTRQLLNADVASDGTPGNDHAGTNRSDFAITPDGRFVAFSSIASNLVPGDTNGVGDVFVHDFLTGATERVSVASDGSQGDDISDTAAISDDGRFVAFWSVATNLVPPLHTNTAFPDVFLRDRQAGTTVRVSLKSDGSLGNGGADRAVSISGDGQRVLFVYAGDALDLSHPTEGQLYVRDLQAATTHFVGPGGIFSISRNGQLVAFSAPDSNLVPGDTNGIWDVFVGAAGGAGSFERESVATGGAQDTGGGGVPFVALSSDGRFVAFTTDANGLVPGDNNTGINVFLRDRQAGTTTRFDVASDGTPAPTPAQPAVAVDDDGHCVAFIGNAHDFDPCASGAAVLVHCEGSFPPTTTTLHCPGSGGGGGNFVPVQTDLAMASQLVNTRVPPGRLATALTTLIGRIDSAVTDASQAPNRRRARGLSSRATRTAGRLASRLHSRAARRTIPPDALALLQDAVSQLKRDLVALRGSL